MRAIISSVFPNATIVLDCFRVLKRCHDAIEEVRLHLKRNAQVELRRQPVQDVRVVYDRYFEYIWHGRTSSRRHSVQI